MEDMKIRIQRQNFIFKEQRNHTISKINKHTQYGTKQEKLY